MRLEYEGRVMFPDVWPDLAPWLTMGCTTRRFAMGGEQPMGATVEALELIRLLGVNAPLFRAWQKHTTTVAVVTDDDRAAARAAGYRMWTETDAVISMEPGAVCVVFTADCVPVLLADARTRAVAAVHSGWRGTMGRIAERAVATMVARGSRVGDLRAWIGPCASGRCYEVSQELIASFAGEFTDAVEAGVTFANGRLLDLPALVMWQLRKAGLGSGAVVNSDICTIEHCRKYPSYRMRESDTEKARIINFIYGAPPA